MSYPTKAEVDDFVDKLLRGKRRLLKPGHTNTKLAKSLATTYILNLSPHKQNSQGVNLCGFATPGCQSGCLFMAGMGRIPNVVFSRQLTTELYLADRSLFLTLLSSELQGLQLLAERSQPIAVRLNGTSDLDFPELLRRHTGHYPMEQYPDLLFYDYSKSYKHWEKYHTLAGTNRYHITFSRSETNWLQCRWVLEQGGTVACVFEKHLPKTYLNYPVIDGTLNDERWNDPKGVIVGLTYKRVPKDDPQSNPFIVHD